MAEKSYGATLEKPTVPLDDDAALFSSHAHHRVILFACLVCLVVVGEGYDVGIINGAAVRMKDDLRLTTWEISLVIMMTPLFFMPGSLAGGAIADSFGRRPSLMVCCVMLILGPLGMAISTSLFDLLVTRAFVGFGIGMGFVVVSMYIAEVSPREMRGRLTAMEDIFLNVGILAGYLVSWYLLGIQNDWRWMLALGSILPMLVLILIALPHFPESPRWLYMHGRTEEAEMVLMGLVSREEAEHAIKAMAKQAEGSDADFVTWQQVFSGWRDTKIRNMLLAGITVACSQMLCGYLPMIFYSSTVLKTAMSEQNAFIGTVIMGFMKLLVVLIMVTVLEQLSRRLMLLSSATVCGLACAWLAVAFTIEAGNVAQIFGFALFMAGFSLGLGPIAFVYVSEVFETKWRAKGMATAFFCSRILGATSALFFPLLVDSIGVSTSFWLLTISNVIVFFLIWMLVFETKGTSLEDVAELYATGESPRALPGGHKTAV